MSDVFEFCKFVSRTYFNNTYNNNDYSILPYKLN